MLKRNPNFFLQKAPIIKPFSEKFELYISLDLWENLNFWIFPQRRAAAETPPLPHSFIYKNGGTYHQKRKHRVHGSCAHQRGAPPLYN